MLQPTHPNPLMVHYLGSQIKHNNIGDACKFIQEGKFPDLGIMLAKNHPKVLVDDGMLDEDKSN